MSKLLGSRLIADRVDDDLIRRLIHAIEDASEAYDDPRPFAETVKERLDGDAFLAYQHVRELLAESYPDVYGEIA